MKWSPLASDDLLAVERYIGVEKQSPKTAKKFVARLTIYAGRLRVVPLSGWRVAEDESQQLLEIVFRDFRIIYRLMGEPLRS